MKREIFCLDCGLFYVGEQHTQDKEGALIYDADIWNCPNAECPSHTSQEPAGKMSTDSTGYAYFSDANAEQIQKLGWSSPQYAPPDVIEQYKKNGLTIR